MAKRTGLVLLVTLVATGASAEPDPALRCQRAIERGGLAYARAVLAAASDCATDGVGPIDACLDGAIAGAALGKTRARWEAKVADACATTDVGPALGYFPTCAGEPAACAASPGGVGCLACRVEQHLGTAVEALHANAPATTACRAAIAKPGVKALGKLLGRLAACLRRPDSISIAVCMDAGDVGARLDGAVAAWRADAVAACATIDPLATLGYPALCSGVPPEPVNSCQYSAPPCTMPAASGLDGAGPDDDVLDCLECRVEEAGLAVARELYGANLCCDDSGCHEVRSRASCRRAQGTPGYFENQPFTLVATSQPYGAHGLDTTPDGALYVVSGSVVRVADPAGNSAPGDVLANSVSATGAAVDAAGNVFAASRCIDSISRVTPLGAVTTVVGTGVPGYSGDGGPASAAQIVGVNRVAFDAGGNLWFVQSGLVGFYCNHFIPNAERLRMVDSAGIIHTVATSAPLMTPFTLHASPDGGMLVGEYLPNRAVHVDPAGVVTRIAGRFEYTPGGFSGDGGPALRARFHRIEGLRPGAGGELYIGDVENHRVRMIDRHGSVITIAGTGVIGTDPDFAPASLHTIGFPAELTVHPDGRVFFSDTCANFINYLRVLVPVPF